MEKFTYFLNKISSEDDDSGGACNARLTVTFPEDATYRIAAASFGSGDSPYRLTVGTAEGPVLEGPCPGSAEASADELLDLPTAGRNLEVGGEFSGRLDEVTDASFNGAPVQAWTLEA